MITKHTEFPDLKWWQRWIRKLAGGQDWAVIIFFAPESDQPHVRWLTGIDMRNPIENTAATAETTIVNAIMGEVDIYK